MNLKVEIQLPSPVFKPYIEYYKYIEGYLSGSFKVIPATNEEMYFHFNPGNYIISSPGKYAVLNPLIHFQGLQGYSQEVISHIPSKSYIRSMAVVFKPYGIQKLFRLTHAEISAYVIDAEELFRNSYQHIWYRLQNASDPGEMKKRLENFLQSFLKNNHVPTLFFNHILERIKWSKGLLTIGQLCDEMHLTPRTLQRKFKDETGMSPKEFLQITRLNYALNILQSDNNLSLTEISYMSGYYDQSHFIRDIRKLLHAPPGILKKEKQALDRCDNRVFMKVSEQ